MAVSYDDLDDQQLGKQTRIANMAEEQLNEAATQAELEAEEAELSNMAEVQVNEESMATAQAVIDEMDAVHAQGGDPQAVLDGVPEEIAQLVVQLLEQEIQAEEAELQAGQQGMSVDTPDIPPDAQGQAVSNQENGSITDKARRIASNI